MAGIFFFENYIFSTEISSINMKGLLPFHTHIRVRINHNDLNPYFKYASHMNEHQGLIMFFWV